MHNINLNLIVFVVIIESASEGYSYCIL